MSYAWTDESTAHRRQNPSSLQGARYRSCAGQERYAVQGLRFCDFMERIGRGKCIVVVLSKKYLESKSCMFEMTEIAERGDIRTSVPDRA